MIDLPVELLRIVQTLELSVTWAMVGLIWLIQIVQYPLFAEVGTDHFPRFEQQHCARISFVVVPLMLAEAALCGAHLWLSDITLASSVGAALLILVWLSTFLVQVPLHKRLTTGFDALAHRALVRSNWVRTGAWSARGGLLLGTLLSSLS